MRINILHGGCFPVPPLLGGAVEKIWFILAKEFAKAGHSVVQVSRLFKELPRSEVIDGVEHRRLAGYDRPTSFGELFLRELWFSFRALASLPNADITVTHSITAPFLIRKARFGKLYVHVARFPKGQMRWYSNAARIQAISNSVAEAIVSQTPQLKEKVVVIPYPHCQEPFADLISSEDKQNVILYVGRVHPEKGVHLLIEAFAKLPEGLRNGWELRIVGPWEAELGGGGTLYFELLKKLAHPVGGLVKFIGFVADDRELAKQYSHSKLFVYPSLAKFGEAFGAAPLEASFYKCPMIVSRLTCFKEFFRNKENGLDFAHESNQCVLELRKALSVALENESDLNRWGNNAQKIASEFSLSRVSALYLQDFFQVIYGRE